MLKQDCSQIAIVLLDGRQEVIGGKTKVDRPVQGGGFHLSNLFCFSSECEHVPTLLSFLSDLNDMLSSSSHIGDDADTCHGSEFV